MTALQEPQTTDVSLTRMKREDWLNWRNQERELWIAQHQKIGELTLTGSVRVGRSWFITWICSCGVVGKSRWSDLKARINTDTKCRSCIMRQRMSNITSQQLEQLKLMSNKAAIINRKDPRFTTLRRTCTCAKKRCCNSNTTGYENYGGRGIKFLFGSPSEMAEWIINNIGYKPSSDHSLDRIDNNRHYEAGNLRWATRKEQNSNKRAYKVGPIGQRIQRLIQETDFCYESIRTFIKQGMTDEEIRNRKHSNTGRLRSARSSSLRPCQRRKKP